MNKPVMYMVRFHMWDGTKVEDQMGWLNRDGEKAKAARQHIHGCIESGKPFWTYSHIIFPDTLRLVEFYWAEE